VVKKSVRVKVKKLTNKEKLMNPDLQKKDITTESWRTYDFGGRMYTIHDPQELYYREGGTTHRVVDIAGVVHCVPAPGYHGCVLRWKNKDVSVPVNF